MRMLHLAVVALLALTATSHAQQRPPAQLCQSPIPLCLNLGGGQANNRQGAAVIDLFGAVQNGVNALNGSKGQPNGIASLNPNGQLPVAQLPPITLALPNGGSISQLQITGPGSTGDASGFTTRAIGGTQSRSLADRATDRIDVRDYVSDMTGATDQTAQLQAALNIATARQATLYGCGNVRISAEVTVTTTAAFGIEGCTDKGFQITTTTPTQNGIVINGGVGASCHIDRLSINAAPDFKTSGVGLALHNTVGCVVTNSIFNGQYTSLLLDGTILSRISNNKFQAGVVGGVGVILQGSDTHPEVASVLMDNIGDNVPAHAPSKGLQLSGHVEGTYFIRNSFLHYDIGLYANPGASIIQNLFFSQNAWDVNNLFGALFDSNVGEIFRIQIQGDWFAATINGPGLQVQGTGAMSAWQISSAVARANGQSGMLLTGNLTNVLITAPQVSGNSGAAPGQYNGIEIGGGVTHISITGGQSRPMPSDGTPHAYGVVLRPGASDYIAIQGVDMSGNAVASLLDQSTGTHKSIVNNF